MARPKKPNYEALTVPVGTKVDPVTGQLLKRICKKRDRKMSEVARAALTEFVERHRQEAA